MSRKEITENIENMGEIPADLGPALKLLGTVLTEKFQGANGMYLSKEEREKNKTPLAEVIESDIQIRFGNRMMTLVPATEGKPMVSIPIGQSDKKTPATIPREWLVGALIDGLLSIFDGDTQVVGVFINSRIKKAIEQAMEVNEDGKMKVVTSKLPTHDHPVEVAEFLEALKYSFVSKSAGSAKLNIGIEFTDLEQITPVEEEVVEEEEVQADWHEEAAKRLIGGDSHEDSSLTVQAIVDYHDEENEIESPMITEQDVIEAVDSVEDAELVAFIQEGDNTKEEWKPQENAVETITLMNEMTEKARDIDMQITRDLTEEMVSHAFPNLRGEKGLVMRETWLYSQVAHHDQIKTNHDEIMTANMLAELAGVNVQTIKRIIDYIVEKGGYEEDWTDFTQAPEDFAPHTFGFECERSDTGRYVRGSEIYIHYFDDEGVWVVDSTDSPVFVEAPPTLKEADETDPALRNSIIDGSAKTEDQFDLSTMLGWE